MLPTPSASQPVVDSLINSLDESSATEVHVTSLSPATAFHLAIKFQTRTGI
jgi:hypothetical protein